MTKPLTLGLTHLAIGVRDLDRTQKFYHSVFSMKTMYKTPDFLQLTTPSCKDILVFEKRERRFIKKGGIDHFGFRLRHPADISAIRKRILKAGGKITEEGEFLPGSPYLFFADPDGYSVEVWYEKLK